MNETPILAPHLQAHLAPHLRRTFYISTTPRSVEGSPRLSEQLLTLDGPFPGYARRLKNNRRKSDGGRS